MDLQNNPWWMVLLAAAPSTGSGAWVVWRYLVDRRDKKEEGSLTREQILMRDLDNLRTADRAAAADLFARARDELKRRDDEAERRDARIRAVETENERLQRALDKWGDIARGWKARCHYLKHDLENLRTAINGMLVRQGRPERRWSDETLPEIEAILPDNIAYFSRLRTSQPVDSVEPSE